MGSSSRSMIDSLSDTMNYLSSLEEEFIKLKQDANRLESMNKEMYNNITRIESTYLKKVPTWSYPITTLICYYLFRMGNAGSQ